MRLLNAGVDMTVLSGAAQCAKYIAAAIYMSGNASQSKALFTSALGYIGPGLDLVSAAALVIGVIFFAAEAFDHFKSTDKRGKNNEG